MRKNWQKAICIFIGLFSLLVSLIWTYRGLKTYSATIIYLFNILIILLLVSILMHGKGRSRKAVDHSNYTEWITDGNIENCSKLSVSIKTLEDLVRLAIDLDKRVIHDSKLGKYFVLAEDMTYIHDPGLINPMLDDKQQLGRILIEQGMLTTEELETGLYYQKRIGCKLGESLLALGFMDESTLYSMLAAQQKIAYYELDTKKEYHDTGWTAKMSINKARALQALPLGYRSDGMLVIACGDVAKSGVSLVLREIFGEDIYIVAARPIKIYEILNKVDVREQANNGFAQLRREHRVEAYERLSEKEWEQITTAYYNGRLDTGLFIKAAGLVDPLLLIQIPNKDIIISWLTGKGILDGQVANLIKTLERIIITRNTQKAKTLPDLMELLYEAHYITREEAEWAAKKSQQVGWPIQQILIEDYIVADDTMEVALLVLDTMDSILRKARIY